MKKLKFISSERTVFDVASTVGNEISRRGGASIVANESGVESAAGSCASAAGIELLRGDRRFGPVGWLFSTTLSPITR